MSEKISEEVIYNTIVEMFPGQFERLKKMPKKPVHPGDEPRKSTAEPRIIRAKKVFPSDVALSEVYDWIKENNLPSTGYSISRENVVVGQETYITDDWVWDSAHQEEVYIPKIKQTRNVYSEDETSVIVSVQHENPNWKASQKEAERNHSRWVSAMETYRRKRDEYNRVKEYNSNLYRAVRSCGNIWSDTVKYLKGNNADFMEKHIERLRSRLEAAEDMYSKMVEDGYAS